MQRRVANKFCEDKIDVSLASLDNSSSSVKHRVKDTAFVCDTIAT